MGSEPDKLTKPDSVNMTLKVAVGDFVSSIESLREFVALIAPFLSQGVDPDNAAISDEEIERRITDALAPLRGSEPASNKSEATTSIVPASPKDEAKHKSVTLESLSP